MWNISHTELESECIFLSKILNQEVKTLPAAIFEISLIDTRQDFIKSNGRDFYTEDGFRESTASLKKRVMHVMFRTEIEELI